MARAALERSLEDAAAAGVSRRTVLRFERHHRDVKPELIEALRRAYQEVEVRFIDGDAGGGVVAPPWSCGRGGRLWSRATRVQVSWLARPRHTPTLCSSALRRLAAFQHCQKVSLFCPCRSYGDSCSQSESTS